jgi:methyl-accepting chemotaxis protein
MFWKLLIAPGIVLVFLVMLGGVVYRSFSAQHETLDFIYNQRFKAYQQGVGLQQDVSGSYSDAYRVISWTNFNYDRGRIDALIKELNQTLDRAARTTAAAGASKTATAEEQELYATAAKQLAAFRAPVLQAADMASVDPAVASMVMQTADTEYAGLAKTMTGLATLQDRLAKESFEAAVRASNKSLYVLAALSLVTMLLSGGITVAVARMILKPVKAMNERVSEIAEGDLSRPLEVTTADEIGQLASSVETMRSKIGDAVGQASHMSVTLSSSASEQAAAIEEISASVEEMAGMTHQNAERAGRANDLMSSNRRVAENLEASLTRLTGSMKEMVAASTQTQKIVKTIDEIAFQTDILALNAAVEAARAGHAGAGFAVVAEEVRTLAVRAAEAAGNTSTLLDNVVTRITAGERMVTEAVGGFAKMTTTLTDVVALVEEIATASRDQAKGVDQISRAVGEIEKATQQNAAGAEELAAAMSEFRTAESTEGTTGAAFRPTALPAYVRQAHARS